jgi:hypothetical protein
MKDLVLEREGVVALLHPERGGHISSLVVEDGFEILAAPWIPRNARSMRSGDYSAGGVGGFDDCIPSISAEPLEGVPDHGDAWTLPWRVIDSGASWAELTVDSPLGYRLTRRVDVGRTITLDTAIEDLTDSGIDVVWAAHPLFAVDDQTVLCFRPDGDMRIEACIGHEPSNLGDLLIDLSEQGWSAMPERLAFKLFARRLTTTPWLGYRERNLRTLIECDRDDVWWGLWVNRGAFPANAPRRHVAIEPTFGSHDSLSASRSEGSSLSVAPGGKEQWTVRIRIEHWPTQP